MNIFNVIRKHVLYASYLVKHKWYVFIFGLEHKVPVWRLILHDIDKFLPSMWTAYANFFNGERTPEVRQKFREAWRGHANRNDHHYQHWISTSEKGSINIHEMSDVARREMLADWRSANLVISGSIQFGSKESLYIWYNLRRAFLPIGPQTKQWLDEQITLLKERNV